MAESGEVPTEIEKPVGWAARIGCALFFLVGAAIGVVAYYALAPTPRAEAAASPMDFGRLFAAAAIGALAATFLLGWVVRLSRRYVAWRTPAGRARANGGSSDDVTP